MAAMASASTLLPSPARPLSLRASNARPREGMPRNAGTGTGPGPNAGAARRVHVQRDAARQSHHQVRVPAAGASLAMEASPSTAGRSEKVRGVTSVREYEEQLEAAREKKQLLVVEFTREALPNTERTYQALVDLADNTPDVTFLRVFADRSPELKELCVSNGINQIPSYVFFRNGQRVHEGQGMQPDKLREQVLYYGQTEYPVRELESAEDLQTLLQEHSGSDRLVVIQTTLNFCGPCARVYPAVLQLSHKMAGSVVFGRLFGDANESTRNLLTDLGIVEVPTFLFYRNNELLGRYIGSAKGDLVGEVLRYQGVECT